MSVGNRRIGGDIGGTKTLLRCVEANGEVSLDERYTSGDHATFDELLRAFTERLPGPVEAACFAVAGPVWQGRAKVTNLDWTLDAQSLASAFSIGRVSLINDFHAVAAGVPLLGENDLLPLHRGERDRSAPVAILGAGTGLGEAFLIHGQVVSSEGGHGDFAPQDEEQTRLFLALQERYGGHVSWERLLSGTGLVNIFTFLGGDEIDAADVADLADRGDPRATRAFEIFVDIYGAEAGNMALRVLARGGVYLAGGIAAKNVPRFTDGRFVEAFLRKGRFRELMEGIPVDLIVNEEVGLIGAMHVAGEE